MSTFNLRPVLGTPSQPHLRILCWVGRCWTVGPPTQHKIQPTQACQLSPFWCETRPFASWKIGLGVRNEWYFSPSDSMSKAMCAACIPLHRPGLICLSVCLSAPTRMLLVWVKVVGGGWRSCVCSPSPVSKICITKLNISTPYDQNKWPWLFERTVYITICSVHCDSRPTDSLGPVVGLRAILIPPDPPPWNKCVDSSKESSLYNYRNKAGVQSGVQSCLVWWVLIINSQIKSQITER